MFRGRVNLGDVSRFRGEMMGIAILLIVLRHVFYPVHDAFYGLWRCGAMGTEMFFLFSGMGCWFSLYRRPGLKRFYLRRFLRIYPTWILVSATFFTYLYVHGRGYSRSIPELLADITFGWNYWRVGDWTFWFLPAIMLIYLIAPFYIRLIRRYPACKWLVVAVAAWCFAVAFIPSVHAAVGQIYRFWAGLLTFLVGVNAAGWVQQQKSFASGSLFWTLLVFAFSLGICYALHQQNVQPKPWFLLRMFYLPPTVCLILLLSSLLKHVPDWLNRVFSFLGGISLEIYLLHVEFVYRPLKHFCHGYWPSVFIVLLVSIPLAWLLGKFVSYFTKHLSV